MRDVKERMELAITDKGDPKYNSMGASEREAWCMVIIAQSEIERLRKQRRVLSIVATIMFALYAWCSIAPPAHAQNVNRIVDVPPGTVITVTRGGETLFQQTVHPGRVQLSITYLDRAVSMTNRRPHGVRKR